MPNNTSKTGLVGLVYVVKSAAEAASSALATATRSLPNPPRLDVVDVEADVSTCTHRLMWSGVGTPAWEKFAKDWQGVVRTVCQTVKFNQLIGVTTIYTSSERIDNPEEPVSIAGNLKTQPLEMCWFDDERIRLMREPYDRDQPGERVYIVDSGSDPDVAIRLLFADWSELVSLDRIGHKVCWLRQHIRQSETHPESVDISDAVASMTDRVNAAVTAGSLERAVDGLGQSLSIAIPASGILNRTIAELTLQQSILHRLAGRHRLLPLLAIFLDECDLMLEELRPKHQILQADLQSATAVVEQARTRLQAISTTLAGRVTNILTLLGAAVAFSSIFDSEFAGEVLAAAGISNAGHVLRAIVQLGFVSIAAIVVWGLISIICLIPNYFKKINDS